MLNVSEINCHGAVLLAPSFLVDLWPHELPLKDWPTFCGAGDGVGDKLVPDTMCFNNWFGGHSTAYINPACFIHDITSAICDHTVEDFQFSNRLMLKNSISLVNSQLNFIHAWAARRRCVFYYRSVDVFGWFFFEPDGVDPYSNPTVKSKLQRLAYASLNIPVTR